MMSTQQPGLRFRLSGDRGLLVEYGNGIDLDVSRRVRANFIGLTQDAPAWLVEAIPTYRSILVIYDPTLAHPEKIVDLMILLDAELEETSVPPPRTVEIPVLYGGEAGPDLEFVAAHNRLSVEEVISLHSKVEYHVYMLGFSPGFPYLGGLDPRLHTPRQESPRLRVPAGTVGIANAQTGVYPVATPGGWQLIGRTPLRLFDMAREEPFMLEAGDKLRFRPIGVEEYRRLARRERG